MPMARFALITTLAMLLLAAPQPAPADTRRPDSTAADTASVLIEGLEVFGTRPMTTRGGTSVIRASIDSLAIPAAASAERVLRSLPSIHVRTNSRGEAELSVRGSESRQVAILFDGMPLTLNWDGRTDLSVIPAGALQQVTLTRGLSTLLAGPNVLGGVVEFHSGAAGGAAQAPALSLRSGVDHVGGFGTCAAITAPRALKAGRLTVRAGVGHRDTPGAPLAAGVAEPLPDGDLRVNTDLTETDAFASARFDRNGGGWLSLATAAFRAERGIAAELGVAEPRFWRYPFIARSLTVLSGGSGVRNAPWGGESSLFASFGLDAGRTEIDAHDSGAYETLSGEEDGDQRTLSMRVTGSQTFGRRGELRLGVTSSELTYDERLEPGGTSRYRHRLWSVAGGVHAALPALRPGNARRDRHRPGRGVRPLDLSALRRQTRSRRAQRVGRAGGSQRPAARRPRLAARERQPAHASRRCASCTRDRWAASTPTRTCAPSSLWRSRAGSRCAMSRARCSCWASISACATPSCVSARAACSGA
jgi:iron complex outermembrane receptor protein